MKPGFLKTLLGLGRRPAPPVDFAELFAGFREVLARHNAAMENMADLGEKLGGEYLFDINYLRPAYDELQGNVLSALASFRKLTGDGYPELKDTFLRIDGEMKRLVYDEPLSSGPLVVDLADITWDMEEEVGGKSMNLAEVTNGAGLPVPPGFAVTAHAFTLFLQHNGIDHLIREGMGPEELAVVRARIMDGELPVELAEAMVLGLGRMSRGLSRPVKLAVRSSAVGEDGEFSFAGQFRSVLNVEVSSLATAYRTVIASLFEEKAAVYLRRLGTGPEAVRMGVCCLLMVDARSSGVMYSSDPAGDYGSVIITSSPGTGEAVVEGMVEADHFTVKKGESPAITSRRRGAGAAPSLSDEETVKLAVIGSRIEAYFRRPQDIEWAIARDGGIVILQSRPVRLQTAGAGAAAEATAPAHGLKVLLQGSGVVVQRGAGAGKVFVAGGHTDLDNFPRGGVLVARTDSSDFIKVMPLCSAIITEIGSPTSHMASLCREFRLPAVVGVGSAAKMLAPGHEVTVVAGDGGQMAVYDGIVRELLVQPSGAAMDDLYEFRRKRYILRYITPLNLVDPMAEEFRASRCRTVHDILRFIHEKSVMSLVSAARSGASGRAAVRLELPVPAGIVVVDLGGGMQLPEGSKEARMEEITSLPLGAVLQGLTYPGVWHAETVPLTAHDFMGSMMRMPDIRSWAGPYADNNLAVIARDYLSLSLRFGYHFTVVDCYCSERMRNNHLYFRFGGGATDIQKRSRRVDLISRILGGLGFRSDIRGDLLTARLANVPQEEMLKVLDQVGRLIAYTRQLDAVLGDDESVQRLAAKFMDGDYSFYS